MKVENGFPHVTYLVMALVLGVKVARVNVVACVPIDVYEASIISLVLNNLLLGDFEALAVLEVALTH